VQIANAKNAETVGFKSKLGQKISKKLNKIENITN
jgi:hypothetical protein